jgi:hypothetical protein
LLLPPPDQEFLSFQTPIKCRAARFADPCFFNAATHLVNDNSTEPTPVLFFLNTHSLPPETRNSGALKPAWCDLSTHLPGLSDGLIGN